MGFKNEGGGVFWGDVWGFVVLFVVCFLFFVFVLLLLFFVVVGFLRGGKLFACIFLLSVSNNVLNIYVDLIPRSVR